MNSFGLPAIWEWFPNGSRRDFDFAGCLAQMRDPEANSPRD